MGSVGLAIEGYRDKYLGYVVTLSEGEDRITGRVEDVFAETGSICFRLNTGAVFRLGTTTEIEKIGGEKAKRAEVGASEPEPDVTVLD